MPVKKTEAKKAASKEEAKDVAKKEVKVEVRPAKEPVKKEKPILVTFARWFASKKFRPHWAAGMQAYTDTTRRRTMEEWNVIFKNY